MTIPKSFLDELRQRVTLSDLINRTVPLKRSGREHKACCPFHQETTPSFTVNDEKAFYHCFGCGAHGDVISWMVDHENLAFIDAVKSLAEIAGLEMPAQDPKAAQREEYRSKLIGLNEAVAVHYHECLIGHEEARAYLSGRGIDAKASIKFQIGYAGWTKDSALIGKWNAKTKLTQLGLIRERDEGGHFDFFRKRIIIPIHDTRGQVIGFGGRILGKGEPKYLNSPDTPVFDKGRTLFNHHRAAPEARKADRLIVVEGYMDVIALDFVGIGECVAPNGTAITEHQLRQCWRLNPKPIFVFDGDNAGKKAAVRAAMRALPLLEPGKTVSFAFPPDGKDPDDLSRENGADAVESMLESAISVPKLLWNDLTAQFDPNNPDQAAELRSRAREIVQSVRNSDVRKAYGQEFYRLLSPEQNFRRNYTQTPRMSEESPAQAMRTAILAALFDWPQVFARHYDAAIKIVGTDPRTLELFEAALDIILDNQETPEGLVDAIKRQGFEGHLIALRERVTLRLNITSEQMMSDLLKQAMRERLRK